MVKLQQFFFAINVFLWITPVFAELKEPELTAKDWFEAWTQQDQKIPLKSFSVAVIQDMSATKISFTKLNPIKFNNAGMLATESSQTYEFKMRSNSRIASKKEGSSCLKSLEHLAFCLNVQGFIINESGAWSFHTKQDQEGFTEKARWSLDKSSLQFEEQLQSYFSATVGYHGVVVAQIGSNLLVKANFPDAKFQLRRQGLLVGESDQMLFMKSKEIEGIGLVEMVDRFGAFMVMRILISELPKNKVSIGTKIILERKK